MTNTTALKQKRDDLIKAAGALSKEIDALDKVGGKHEIGEKYWTLGPAGYAYTVITAELERRTGGWVPDWGDGAQRKEIAVNARH